MFDITLGEYTCTHSIDEKIIDAYSKEKRSTDRPISEVYILLIMFTYKKKTTIIITSVTIGLSDGSFLPPLQASNAELMFRAHTIDNYTSRKLGIKDECQSTY